MRFTKTSTIKLTIIASLTVALSVFLYFHETFPKSLRAATALFGAPTAIASGLSHYLNLGIPVYDTPMAVVLSNLIASVIIVILVDTFLRWRRK